MKRDYDGMARVIGEEGLKEWMAEAYREAKWSGKIRCGPDGRESAYSIAEAMLNYPLSVFLKKHL